MILKPIKNDSDLDDSPPPLAYESYILALPLELINEILKLLDFQEVIRCTEVCKQLNGIIRSSLELQYKIELGADGLVDGLLGPMSTAERLELLFDRRRRWRSLDWTARTSVSIPGPCQAYELVAGVFAKSMAGAQGPGSHNLISTWLPSRTQPAKRIVREELGVSTRDFAIDPSQDLIALVDADDNQDSNPRIRVFLRTVSTNEKHPRAASAELHAPIPFELGSSFIQIVDDVVGMFFWVNGPGLIIWNWQTSEIVINCVGYQLPRGTWDFSFVSNRAFILTAAMGSGTKGLELHNFSTHSGPFVHARTPGKPFETARDSGVHLMSLSYGDRGPRFHMIMHNRLLLSYLPREGGRPEPKIVQWKTWGPKYSRFLEHTISFQWLRYVHGQRVILPPVMRTSQNPQSTMYVLDFNVHPKRTNDPVPLPKPDSRCSYKVFTEPSTVQRRETFKDDVVTYLPYAVMSRLGTFQYSGFMIDDERIIGMKVCSSPHRTCTFSKPSISSTVTILSRLETSMSAEVGSPPGILVSIPDTTAIHVLGESTVELGKGDLTLILTESSTVSGPSSPSEVKNHTPVLALAVGKAAFPLYKTTIFGTLADDVRVYVFTPEIGGERGGRGVRSRCDSYVKIVLPEGVKEAGSAFERLQTGFEKILVHHGLLKEGIEAVADELGKSAREDSAHAAQQIRDSTTVYLADNPPTDSPISLPGPVRTASATSADTTSSIASAASRMSASISHAAENAGMWMAEHLVPNSPPATHQTLSSLSNAYDTAADGYGAGAGEVKDALADAASARIENAYGREAREVAGDVGASAQNVGGALGEVVVGTSGATIATAGIKGAAGAKADQRESEDWLDDREDDAWNDVSI
ncbi:uncharacterized protein LAESUDRAFT_662823 [Laetiporus sulphureus 93-53]|uniref:F-box domain-containing protein n=1 Tax=Laetiporus sulphureus 93-53 TaxID=1314785 RepID=A0A165C020_9APHY|nr:uncharacterized protein LAESUDRAFT_662823 [Laetiporus sulphureus 93-53]KZT01957.1 hypothetical protein LAESUDRAFT_662823 [Laetiporus sulphureus 93-53]